MIENVYETASAEPDDVQMRLPECRHCREFQEVLRKKTVMRRMLGMNPRVWKNMLQIRRDMRMISSRRFRFVEMPENSPDGFFDFDEKIVRNWWRTDDLRTR